MSELKFGVMGVGNMGGAILEGALSSGALEKENVWVYDPVDEKMEHAKSLGVHLAKDDEDLAKTVDIMLCAVKPQQAEEALGLTKKGLEGKAMMSIVAGTSIERLHSYIDATPRILRIMPNTPAMVFAGAFALCKETDLTDEEKAFAEKLYNSIGIVEWVPENLIDTVCGLSGGGPAYVAMFIEAMADAGVKQGLTRDTAYKLSAQTVYGTGKMILEKGLLPAKLKDMVTSPAGTTIEGCEALEEDGMRYAVMDCVNRATERGREL